MALTEDKVRGFVRHFEAITPKSILDGDPGGLSRQSARPFISAQVVISRFMRSSSTSGSVLTARGLFETLSLPLLLALSLKEKMKGGGGGVLGQASRTQRDPLVWAQLLEKGSF